MKHASIVHDISLCTTWLCAFFSGYFTTLARNPLPSTHILQALHNPCNFGGTGKSEGSPHTMPLRNHFSTCHAIAKKKMEIAIPGWLGLEIFTWLLFPKAQFIFRYFSPLHHKNFFQGKYAPVSFTSLTSQYDMRVKCHF